MMAVTSSKDVQGDLELVALGPGGRSEDDYDLPISAAFEVSAGREIPIEHEGNSFRGLSLAANSTRLIRVDLTSPHRYRLGVK